MKNLFQTVRTTLALGVDDTYRVRRTSRRADRSRGERARCDAVEVRGGTAAFDVGTNLSAISVHGKSNALTARLRLRQTPDGPVSRGLKPPCR